MWSVPQKTGQRPTSKMAKSPSGGSAPTLWLVGQNTSIPMRLSGSSTFHSTQELNYNSALREITIPMSSCSSKARGRTPRADHQATEELSRSPALRWIMREGPLSCNARLGKHMILRHNPASRTGEAA